MPSSEIMFSVTVCLVTVGEHHFTNNVCDVLFQVQHVVPTHVFFMPFRQKSTKGFGGVILTKNCVLVSPVFTEVELIRSSAIVQQT